VDYRFQIARRYLLGRRDVSLISIITGISMTGVALGVAALIVVLSVMNGFYDFVRDLLVSIDPHVRVVSTDERGLANADSLLDLTGSVNHVESASPYVEGKALFLHPEEPGTQQVVIVRGVDPAALSEGREIVQQTGVGSFNVERTEDGPGIVVGRRLSQQVGVVPSRGDGDGSRVGLLSAPGIERTLTQVFGSPPVRRYEVRGLFEMQAAYDQNHVFIALDEAQRLFRMDGRVSGIDLRLSDLDRADEVKAALQGRLSPERFQVKTWYDLQQSLYDVMQLEKWGASAILLLIVVVAAFNIVGSLTMVVIEKRRDIGALQAMGVSRTNIRRIFLLEGALIGAIGTGAGLVLGLGLATLQKHFKLVSMTQAESFLINAYPVSIQFADVFVIAVVAFGLCVLAAFYPAVRASSVEPARAVHLDA
jgi:lipoprotein-releasing system permease protein